MVACVFDRFTCFRECFVCLFRVFTLFFAFLLKLTLFFSRFWRVFRCFSRSWRIFDCFSRFLTFLSLFSCVTARFCFALRRACLSQPTSSAPALRWNFSGGLIAGARCFGEGATVVTTRLYRGSGFNCFPCLPVAVLRAQRRRLWKRPAWYRVWPMRNPQLFTLYWAYFVFLQKQKKVTVMKD